MNITGDDGIGVVQNGLHAVGKNHFYLGAGFPDKAGIVLHIVHASKRMDHRAELGTEALQGKNIGPGINALFIQAVHADEMVAHFIGRIAEHKDDLLAARGNAGKQHGETVAAENGEGNANGLAAGAGLYIGCDLFHCGIVALGTGHYRFSNGDNIFIVRLHTVFFQGLQDGIHSALYYIIAFPEDGGAYPANDSTKHSAHGFFSFYHL